MKRILKSIAILLFRRYVRPELAIMIQTLMQSTNPAEADKYVRSRGLLKSVKRSDAVKTTQAIFSDICNAILTLIDAYGVRKR